MKIETWLLPAALVLITASIGLPQASKKTPDSSHEWQVYGGNPEGTRYSPLAQINRSNVGRLKVAWTYDVSDGGGRGGLQTNPIIVNGVIYGNTPGGKVIALDGATGKLVWSWDSKNSSQRVRGMTWWSQGSDRRIFAGVGRYVYALNAATGEVISSFGRDGRIDLHQDLGRDPEKQSVSLTSPGIVYKDLLIVGGRESESLPASYGDIRAYDTRSGTLRWTFHTIPRPGEYGYETWPRDAWTYTGAANNWAGMSIDLKRGIVYAPTGSAADDFYGANRTGDNLFANCLLALDAATGKRIWHFQAVRHDIWDRDFPSPPALVTVKRDGKLVDAVAQTSKQGFVFLFDRTNGKPLFPMEVRKYPSSPVPGERASATQPLPRRPAPFARQLLTEELLTNRTPAAHQWALEQFRKFRSNGQFVPFSVGSDTVIFPGFDGGAEWGGPAVDPEAGIIYINSNDVAWTGALAPNTGKNSPRSVYLSQCSVCHGEKMTGSPPAMPSLTEVSSRLTATQISAVIKNGKGRMPGFPNLNQDQVSALIDYLASGQGKEPKSSAPLLAMKFYFTGYRKFLDPEGYPAVAPPWGTLNAIDLNTGEYVWKIPFGEYPELAATGQTDTGTENYGGPIVTAGGLLFIGATNFDKKLRAYDKSTGQLLWETALPFPGNATPASYEVNGRQFVVIAAGGGKDPKSRSGGVYVAFAVPDEPSRSLQNQHR